MLESENSSLFYDIVYLFIERFYIVFQVVHDLDLFYCQTFTGEALINVTNV